MRAPRILPVGAGRAQPGHGAARIFCVQCGMRVYDGTEHYTTPSYTGCRPPLTVRFCESTGARLNMPPPDGPNLYASSLTGAAEKAPAFK